MTAFRVQAGVLLLGLAGVLAIAPSPAGATVAAANTCATTLPKDAKTIFDAALPKVAPGVDLRSVLTDATRNLVLSGTIPRGTARESATEAAGCLKQAEN